MPIAHPPSGVSAESKARAVRGASAGALEQELLAALRAWADAVRADPTLLRRQVLVVVPTLELRALLAGRIARACGGALLGVAIHTLHSLAARIHERAFARERSGEALFALLARRAAARERILSDALGELEDGFALAAASISDLLSAGLRPEDQERALAALAAAGRSREAELARALVRAAAGTAGGLAGADRLRGGDLLARAARLLEADPRSLRQRAAHVIGFADAPGQGAALLRALGRSGETLFYLGLPGDPAAPGEAEAGARTSAFPRRFAARLGLELDSAHTCAAPGAPTLAFLSAPSPEAELTEVAARVRELLDQGATPERIGVVARNLAPLALELRAAFRERGIPFSGGGEPFGLRPADRRARAALLVLRRAQDAPLEAWLTARSSAGGAPSDLHLALRALGAARLRDLAELDLDAVLGRRSALPLPARGAASPDDGNGGAGDPAASPLPRRKVPAEALRAAQADARRLVELVGSAWPARAGAGRHARAARAALAELGLDRSDERDPDALLGRALEALGGELPPETELEREELLGALERGVAVRDAPLGGAGAGVQVLDAPTARGIAFEHLFLVGLVRGAFPRRPAEDPLLSDRMRASLRAALPELQLERAGEDEERNLFAELAAAGRHVTLSWHRAVDGTRALAPSPFVARLLRERKAADVVQVPAGRSDRLAPPWLGTPARPRSARESLVQAGLASSTPGLGRGPWAEILPTAIDAPRRGAPGSTGASAAVLARARAEILAELEPDRRTPEGQARLREPGPYLGFVGRARGPRASALWVTSLERAAKCPWQAHLSRALGLERPPDPLAELADLDALLLGNAAHGALDLLFSAGAAARPKTLGEALALGPHGVARPRGEQVESALATAARGVLREAGLFLPGLARALAVRCRPLVSRALELAWPPQAGSGERAAELAVLATEVEGQASLPAASGPIELRFRADRVDLVGGAPVLHDYKTGAPLSRAKKPETVAEHLAAGVAAGTHLQAAVYAGSQVGATGTYLHLRPDAPAAAQVVRVAPDDAALQAALAAAVDALAGAWREGPLPPRFEHLDGETNEACRTCELVRACSKGDSGARRRLRDLARRVIEAPAGSRPADGSALARFGRLWSLGSEDPA